MGRDLLTAFENSNEIQKLGEKGTWYPAKYPETKLSQAYLTI